jgi:transcription antitermination factor NusG
VSIKLKPQKQRLQQNRISKVCHMPILAKEASLYPCDLLDRYLDGTASESAWWALYTRSRREKELARRLMSQDVAFYLPTTERRHRSPAGRIRTTHEPLFPGYVFLCGDDESRRIALATSCISKCFPVHDGRELAVDLQQISRLSEVGETISPELELGEGTPVRVLSGPFEGFKGEVVRRQGQHRLVVAVHFMQQGASVQLEDCDLEKL